MKKEPGGGISVHSARDPDKSESEKREGRK